MLPKQLRATAVANLLFISSVILFASLANAQSNARPELAIDDKFAETGQVIQFVLAPTDKDGVVPGVMLKSAPIGAQLDDNWDGTRTFSWPAELPGTHTVIFTVFDGQDNNLSHDVETSIIVAASRITDEILPDENNFQIGNHINDVVKILVDLPVSKSQFSVQQTPLDVANGRVYISNIEIGQSGDGKGLPQKTVVRQGVQNSSGGWAWGAATIDDRTIYDEWHTAPSIAVDKAGYVHVAYNMHYLPWQYKRSTAPHSINEFAFLGQKITEHQRNRVINDNYIDFPTLGTAAIPGNQITYPAFQKDRNNDLFISYRFTATPKHRFTERTTSTGIAAYDVDSREWSAIGGSFPLDADDYEFHEDAGTSSIALAGQKGWTSYHPRLMFDNNNVLYVNWFWRAGTGGRELSRPCLVVSPDRKSLFYTISGELVSAPVSPETCGNLGYSNDAKFLTYGGSAMDANGVPHILLSPVDQSRQIIHFDSASNSWVRENAPFNVSEIFFDKYNSLWAISDGLRIFKRNSGQDSWQEIYNEGAKINCDASVVLDESGQNAFIHTQACNGNSVTVYALRLN